MNTTQALRQDNQLGSPRPRPEPDRTPPLVGGPFRLWSLWEMMEFHADALWHVSRLPFLVYADGTARDALGLETIGPDDLKEHIKHFSDINYREYLETIGLQLAPSFFDDLMGLLESSEPIDPRALKDAALNLYKVVKRELEKCYLFQLTSAEQEHYVDKAPFGEDVVTQFPSASDDIEEASKCLALHRWTASAFHSMRACEVGLLALVRGLGAEPQQRNWGEYLKAVDNAIARKAKTNDFADAAEEAFYRESYALLESFRRAWRNSTMHVEKIYSDKQAEDVFNAARGLMRQLAERLQE